ncbi:MAG: VWA domain-containing protein [Anaerolineae bacterium]
MPTYDFSKVESPKNFEQKCLCVLTLDVSGSMSGSPIDELNQGLQDFYAEIKGDETTSQRLEVSIITFGHQIDTVLLPKLAEEFSMPTLVADQRATKLVDGVRASISLAESRKQYYKSTGQPYYRPWVILITDGKPEPSNQDVDGLASEILTGMNNKGFHFYAVGVQSADMETLRKISSPSMPPAMLMGLKFREFFKWLSASMSTVTSSQEGTKIDLPDPSSWMHGFAI